MECYHYETFTETSTDNEGNTTTTTRTEKVVTHTATENWAVRKWSDSSPPASTLHYLDVLKLARLRTYKHFFYTPAAQMRKRADEMSFRARHSRDVHNDFSQTSDVPFQDNHVLVYNPAKGAAPWYTSYALVLFLDIFFLLGWIQRYIFVKSVCKIEYELNKTMLD